MAPQRVYDDAFTIQRVEDNDVNNFNFVYGMVPFVQNMCIDVSTLILDITQKKVTICPFRLTLRTASSFE